MWCTFVAPILGSDVWVDLGWTKELSMRLGMAARPTRIEAKGKQGK